MAVKRESIDRLFDYDVLIESRLIVLADAGEDGVDDAMANKFLKAMCLLENANTNPIRIILKSIGGDIFNGMAIFDSIQQSKCHMLMEVYGAAMSMGGVILQAADERVMQPHALLMLHDGTFGVDDTTRTFENWAVVAKALRRQMYEILAQRTGRTIRHWEKMCQSDYILTAKEALAAGLIDRIAESTP